jgi:limonene-1,2-epoxide hydrolase
MSPQAVVEAFIESWNRMDFDAVVAALAPDIHYHNIPMEPIEGWDNVAQYLRGAWIFSECEWSLLNIAAAGDTVLTERVDAFVINGHKVALPLMGVFVVVDGRISQWRDYFDLADYQRQLQAAGVG